MEFFMLSWLRYKYEEWKFEREFQKKKKKLMELDPFIYDIPSIKENTEEANPTRYKTGKQKDKDINF